MHGMFEIMFKECIKAMKEVDKNELYKNENNQGKPVLLSGKNERINGVVRQNV